MSIEGRDGTPARSGTSTSTYASETPMQKPIAFAVFALITLATLGTTTAVANASTSASEGRGHTDERLADTDFRVSAQETVVRLLGRQGQVAALLQ
ncbi:hypothetical protein AB0933_22270 [Streptomyces venezuelae]|uniref:hypothetical protein n=1 Tax=Streptomyces venezuelae TaxID=54571 RepID=UPI003453D8BF